MERAKIYYDFIAEFDCVYLINGAFNEKARVITYPAASPLYVTVLPLKALLLPYTVKLAGGKVLSNAELAVSYEVADGHFAVRLAERHNYVYSPACVQSLNPRGGRECRFYRAVKAGDFAAARKMMTAELSESASDDDLAEFFAPYADIIENRFADLSGGFFLINKNTSRGEAFDFVLSGDKISDIRERN